MSNLPDHISYSQLNCYLACPLRYKFHYIDQIPPAFKASALAFGSAIHEAVGTFYLEHMMGNQLTADQMVDVYRHAWAEQEKPDLKFFNGDNPETLKEKATGMLTAFREAFDPVTQVLGVEEYFQLGLGDSPPLTGYIDLIEQDRNGRIIIVDLKTASKKPSATQASQNLQLTAYSLGIQALGFESQEVSLRLDVLTKTRIPELVRLESTRTDQDRDRFVKLVHSVWNAIKQEVWFPKQDWHCNQCPYTEPCSEW